MTDYVHEHFARHADKIVRPMLEMRNGRKLSVQASGGHYCSPRTDRAERYALVEVWCWSTAKTPKAFKPYTYFPNEPASFVPVEVVNQYIKRNGGLV